MAATSAAVGYGGAGAPGVQMQQPKEDGPVPEMLKLNIVHMNGDEQKDVGVRGGSTVQQFVESLQVRADGMEAALMLGDQPLPMHKCLQECVESGATLTWVRESAPCFRLAAFATADCYTKEGEGLRWQLGCEEVSCNVQDLLESTIGFAHAMSKSCMLGMFSIAVELMNPAPLQRMVDSGEFTKLAITKAILECLMRCAFVVNLDDDGDGKRHCKDDEDARVLATLLQHLGTISGVDLLCGREPHSEKAFTQLVQASGRAPHPDTWTALELKLVEDVEKENLYFLSCGEDRQCECAGSFKWCDKCTYVSWVKFLQEFKRCGTANMWFEWDGVPWEDPSVCRCAVAIHAEHDSEAHPNKLASHYIFKWGVID